MNYGDRYWCITTWGDTLGSLWFDSLKQNKDLTNGVIFRTEEEAYSCSERFGLYLKSLPRNELFSGGYYTVMNDGETMFLNTKMFSGHSERFTYGNAFKKVQQAQMVATQLLKISRGIKC